jgi:hypothetical protein
MVKRSKFSLIKPSQLFLRLCGWRDNHRGAVTRLSSLTFISCIARVTLGTGIARVALGTRIALSSGWPCRAGWRIDDSGLVTSGKAKYSN